MTQFFNFNLLTMQSTAIGIEVLYTSEQSLCFHLIVLSKNNDKLKVLSKKEDIKSFDELKKLIDKKTPIILSLNGKSIIHKKVNVTENEDQLTIVTRAIPGFNPEEFNFQISAVNEDQVYVSIIRKSIINRVLEEFVKHELTNIHGSFLGPFSLNNALPYIPGKDEITINNQKLSVKDSIINNLSSSIEEKDNGITIGNDTFSSGLSIAFGSAFSYFNNTQSGIRNSNLLRELHEEATTKRKFELTALTALCSMFLILLINYLVFTSYWNKQNELNYIYSVNASALHQLDTLKKEFQFKKMFLEDNGLLENSRTSLHADLLAKDLPPSIRWTSLRLNPVKKLKSNEEKQINFEKNTIEIEGQCFQSTDLNEWMKQLKKQKVIASISLLNYTQSKKNEPGIFHLRLSLK